MADITNLLYKSPVQYQLPKTATWNCTDAGQCLVYGSTVNYDVTNTARRESRTSQHTVDSSPELEIMAVRKLKHPQPQPLLGRQKPAGNTKPKFQKQGINETHNIPTQEAPPKPEPFDMNLIDPALRDIGLPTKPKSASQDTKTGLATSVKRPASPTDISSTKRHKPNDQSPPPPSKPLPPTPLPEDTKPPKSLGWLPNTWTKGDYYNLAAAVDATFDYRSYASHIKKSPTEVAEVFRGLVVFPILDTIDRHFPGVPSHQNQAETLMTLHKSTGRVLLDDDPSKLSALKARALAEVGAELRAHIENELRTQLKNEGWVQLNKAKDLIAGYEREINEARNENNEKGGKVKVKSKEEAQNDLFAATAMYEKACRADKRKTKMAEKEARGFAAKKLGRPPKKGDKGADFV